MKKHFLLIILGCSAIMVGCGGDDSEDVAVAAEGTLKATVNDEEWVSQEPFAVINDEYISITASNDNGDKLALVIKGATTGTYLTTTLDGQLPILNVALSPANLSYSNPTFSSMGLAGPIEGKVTINELDTAAKIISGNFEVTLRRFIGQAGDSSVIIKDGSFNKVLLEQEDLQMPADSYFTAKVDGQGFEAGTATGAEAFGGKLVLTGLNSLGQSLALQVPNDITPGTYSLSSYGDTYSATYSPASSSTIYSSDSGTLTITAHDTTNKRIEGTFSFDGSIFPDGTGSVVVTEAAFDITYQ